MASGGAEPGLVATVHEAVRRGCQLLIACPDSSLVAEHAASRSTVLLPTSAADPLSAAVVTLAGLHASPATLEDAFLTVAGTAASDTSDTTTGEAA